MKNINSLLLWGALGVAVAVAPLTASAQTGTTRQQKQEVKALSIKNVRASFIAYWLDPVHNAKPAMLRTMTELNVADTLTDAEAEEARLKFETRFPGLVSVSSLDATNTLFVTGTPEAIAKVRAEVAVLDRPLKLVEVEATVVQIDPKDLAGLGLRYITPNTGTTPAIAGAGKSEIVREKLQALAAAGKAKIVSAPRITLIDNIGGQIDIKASLPATIGVRGADGEFRELKAQGQKSEALTVEMLSSLIVVPTVQPDDTVTLDLRPMRRLGLTDSQREIPLRVLGNPQSVVNTKDGDTLVLTRVRLGGSIEDAIAGDKAENTVMLVTARIVRRPGE